LPKIRRSHRSRGRKRENPFVFIQMRGIDVISTRPFSHRVLLTITNRTLVVFSLASNDTYGIFVHAYKYRNFIDILIR